MIVGHPKPSRSDAPPYLSFSLWKLQEMVMPQASATCLSQWLVLLPMSCHKTIKESNHPMSWTSDFSNSSLFASDFSPSLTNQAKYWSPTRRSLALRLRTARSATAHREPAPDVTGHPLEALGEELEQLWLKLAVMPVMVVATAIRLYGYG